MAGADSAPRVELCPPVVRVDVDVDVAVGFPVAPPGLPGDVGEHRLAGVVGSAAERRGERATVGVATAGLAAEIGVVGLPARHRQVGSGRLWVGQAVGAVDTVPRGQVHELAVVPHRHRTEPAVALATEHVATTGFGNHAPPRPHDLPVGEDARTDRSVQPGTGPRPAWWIR